MLGAAVERRTEMMRAIVTNEEPPQSGDLLGQRCGGSYTITALLGEGGNAAIATGSDGAPRGYARYTLVGAGLVGGIVTTVFYLHRGNAKSPAMATAMVVPTRAGLFAGIGWRF